MGDKLELFSPLGENKTFILTEMFDEEKKPLKVARHPQQKVYLKIPYTVNEYDMLRKVYAETYKE